MPNLCACYSMPGPDAMTPEAWSRHEERRELLRQAMVRSLQQPNVCPEWRAVAEPWLRIPALHRPLSDGAPATEGA